MQALVETQIKPFYETQRFTLFCGDCRSVLPVLETSSVDSVVCDPPYELGFMGKGWDRSGIAYDVEVWRECLRVLKPAGHLLAFGGSRTYHRLACAIEDAGFEIRDDIDFWYDANPIFAAFYDSLTDEQKEMLHASAGAPHLSWIYGSGFPKSLDVSKAIDAAAGAERETVAANPNHRAVSGIEYEGVYSGGNTGAALITAPATDEAKKWDGWGTALKPAHEPIVLARKPLIGTIAANVLKHGTGGLNIDGCRIETNNGDDYGRSAANAQGTIHAHNGFEGKSFKIAERDAEYASSLGRWPANVIHDGSDEVLAGFPEVASGIAVNRNRGERLASTINYANHNGRDAGFPDSGSAARFFYCAKSSQEDRNEGLNGVRNGHPTVKPISLARYLCRLITPPHGTVLDPFAGSGSTGKAAMLEGLRFIGIELSEEYCQLAQRRIEAVTKQGMLFT